MQRFKNILVVYNNRVGDDAMLNRATELAARNRGRLTVAEVREQPSTEAVIEQRRLHLDRLVASIRQDSGVEVRTSVLVGTPFLEITREVLRGDHDLVMMTAEGPLGIGKLLFGSTSMHLMRKCPCPVWVTEGQPEHYAGILAAVDVAADEDDPTTRTILELAGSLARLENSELHIVHAWEFVGKDLDTSRSEISPRLMEELVERNEAPLRKRLKALLDKAGIGSQPHSLHLVRGQPELVIPEVAREHEIELIVMGTVSRTGVPGLFIGNTAELVLRTVDAAVLTIKPPGFETPVRDGHGLPIRPRRTRKEEESVEG